MKKLDFTIQEEDIRTLWVHCRHAYKDATLESFTAECKKGYKSYAKNRENPKTFSQWVNGQIMALAY